MVRGGWETEDWRETPEEQEMWTGTQSFGNQWACVSMCVYVCVCVCVCAEMRSHHKINVLKTYDDNLGNMLWRFSEINIKYAQQNPETETVVCVCAYMRSQSIEAKKKQKKNIIPIWDTTMVISTRAFPTVPTAALPINKHFQLESKTY